MHPQSERALSPRHHFSSGAISSMSSPSHSSVTPSLIVTIDHAIHLPHVGAPFVGVKQRHHQEQLQQPNSFATFVLEPISGSHKSSSQQQHNETTPIVYENACPQYRCTRTMQLNHQSAIDALKEQCLTVRVWHRPNLPPRNATDASLSTFDSAPQRTDQLLCATWLPLLPLLHDQSPILQGWIPLKSIDNASGNVGRAELFVSVVPSNELRRMIAMQHQLPPIAQIFSPQQYVRQQLISPRLNTSSQLSSPTNALHSQSVVSSSSVTRPSFPIPHSTTAMLDESILHELDLSDVEVEEGEEVEQEQKYQQQQPQRQFPSQQLSSHHFPPVITPRSSFHTSSSKPLTPLDELRRNMIELEDMHASIQSKFGGSRQNSSINASPYIDQHHTLTPPIAAQNGASSIDELRTHIRNLTAALTEAQSFLQQLELSQSSNTNSNHSNYSNGTSVEQELDDQLHLEHLAFASPARVQETRYPPPSATQQTPIRRTNHSHNQSHGIDTPITLSALSTPITSPAIVRNHANATYHPTAAAAPFTPNRVPNGIPHAAHPPRSSSTLFPSSRKDIIQAKSNLIGAAVTTNGAAPNVTNPTMNMKVRLSPPSMKEVQKQQQSNTVVQQAAISANMSSVVTHQLPPASSFSASPPPLPIALLPPTTASHDRDRLHVLHTQQFNSWQASKLASSASQSHISPHPVAIPQTVSPPRSSTPTAPVVLLSPEITSHHIHEELEEDLELPPTEKSHLSDDNDEQNDAGSDSGVSEASFVSMSGSPIDARGPIVRSSSHGTETQRLEHLSPVREVSPHEALLSATNSLAASAATNLHPNDADPARSSSSASSRRPSQTPELPRSPALHSFESAVDLLATTPFVLHHPHKPVTAADAVVTPVEEEEDDDKVEEEVLTSPTELKMVIESVIHPNQTTASASPPNPIPSNSATSVLLSPISDTSIASLPSSASALAATATNTSIRSSSPSPSPNTIPLTSRDLIELQRAVQNLDQERHATQYEQAAKWTQGFEEAWSQREQQLKAKSQSKRLKQPQRMNRSISQPAQLATLYDPLTLIHSADFTLPGDTPDSAQLRSASPSSATISHTLNGGDTVRNHVGVHAVPSAIPYYSEGRPINFLVHPSSSHALNGSSNLTTNSILPFLHPSSVNDSLLHSHGEPPVHSI